MMTDTRQRRAAVEESLPGHVQASMQSPQQRTAADEARSAKNIARWKAYLPEDCIATMIAMGWDLSE